ncbi:MAG: hypothetical protein KGL53_06170 [Elusimicrobia bacterium]|nr:hypothetical protein [Elusimicrobiota bacterium]
MSQERKMVGGWGGLRLLALAAAMLTSASMAKAQPAYDVSPKDVVSAFEHAAAPKPAELLGRWKIAVYANDRFTYESTADDRCPLHDFRVRTAKDVFDPRHSVLVAAGVRGLPDVIAFKDGGAFIHGYECRMSGGGATLVCRNVDFDCEGYYVVLQRVIGLGWGR